MRLGVLGSGKGSNMAALADAARDAASPYEIAVVLSDVAGAGILARAAERGLPGEFIPPGSFRTKLDEEAEARFVARLQAAAVDYVVLAGFMRILKGDFLKAFTDRVINLHPSLLPSFPGLEAWRQALEWLGTLGRARTRVAPLRSLSNLRSPSERGSWDRCRARTLGSS